ncbi:MAG TPA: hypothetical protein VFU23_13560 [Gemmatimonadales bacterium]|nr:hypothetical protein [Gemmatimonadales bacterium]
MIEKNLQERYRQGLEARTAEGRAGCVTTEEMIALAERSLPEAARLRLLDHVMSCSRCHAEFVLADSLAETQRRRRNWLPYLAAAAVLVIAAGATLLRTSSPSPGSEPTRGDESLLIQFEPGAEIGVGSERRFTWGTAGPGAEYRLELWDSGGVALYHASTTDTSAILPDSVSLRPGARYSWWVRAALPDGRQAASPIRRLRVTNP